MPNAEIGHRSSEEQKSMSVWYMVSILGTITILLSLIGIRYLVVTGDPQQELREARRVIYDTSIELESTRNELRTVSDSVRELRAVQSLLATEVASLREDLGQYYSDTHARVVVDLYDITVQELEALEDAAHRAIQYHDLLEWLEEGRRLQAEHQVPQVDTIEESATLARLQERQRVFRDRFRQLSERQDSMREAGDDFLTWTGSSTVMFAASDTARFIGDSVFSIWDARSERSRATRERIVAQYEWSIGSPTAWREFRFGVSFDQLRNEDETPDSESPFSRLHSFQESIVAGEPGPLSAMLVFLSMLDLPPLDRLLPRDRLAFESQIQLFLNQRREILAAPLEVRIESIDEPMAVVGTGTTVLDNLAAAHSELTDLRRAILLAGTTNK